MARRCMARWRRRRRRSRSDSPPQMPNFSPLAKAYSRQSSRTTHPRHTSLASRVEAPRSGKNRSGSTPMQFAFVCQLRSWGPYINDTMSIDTSPSQSSTRPRAKPHSTDVVTDMSSFPIRTGNARKSCSPRGEGSGRAVRRPRVPTPVEARDHPQSPTLSGAAVTVRRQADTRHQLDIWPSGRGRPDRRPGAPPPPDRVSRRADPGSGGWSCGPGNRPTRNRPIRRARWRRCVPG
jgi:hypothetical protein